MQSAADLNAILNMTARIYAGLENKSLFNWPVEQLAEELKSVNVLVVESGGGLAGFLGYRVLPDNLEISVLATDPHLRRMGFQTALIKYLQDLAAKQHCGVLLEVHELNRSARGLYQKLGFHSIHTRRKYYRDAGNALVLRWECQ